MFVEKEASGNVKLSQQDKVVEIEAIKFENVNRRDTAEVNDTLERREVCHLARESTWHHRSS